MLLSSLLLIPFPSYGVAEVIYIMLVFFWNITIFIKTNKIEFVLTYNIGCSLNFINSINLDNIKKVHVMHPITFLDENLV